MMIRPRFCALARSRPTPIASALVSSRAEVRLPPCLVNFPAGNQTSWGSQAYTWDPMGAMQSFRETTVNDWAYAYDPDGERVLVFDAKTGNSVFRLRGLDAKVLREIKLTGGVWSWAKDWIYRDGTLLATVDSADAVRHAHPDHLGSPRVFTDAVGTVKGTYHYYPFGEQATAPSPAEALRYTGHERDGNGSAGTVDDLDYMHARYYQPQMGRFLSIDPINTGKTSKGGSWNKYAYVSNRPMSYVDPTGESGVKYLIRGVAGFYRWGTRAQAVRAARRARHSVEAIGPGSSGKAKGIVKEIDRHSEKNLGKVHRDNGHDIPGTNGKQGPPHHQLGKAADVGYRSKTASAVATAAGLGAAAADTVEAATGSPTLGGLVGFAIDFVNPAGDIVEATELLNEIGTDIIEAQYDVEIGDEKLFQ
jgi:RHS repeat-associated protein